MVCAAAVRSVKALISRPANPGVCRTSVLRRPGSQTGAGPDVTPCPHWRTAPLAPMSTPRGTGPPARTPRRHRKHPQRDGRNALRPAPRYSHVFFSAETVQTLRMTIYFIQRNAAGGDQYGDGCEAVLLQVTKDTVVTRKTGDASKRQRNIPARVNPQAATPGKQIHRPGI